VPAKEALASLLRARFALVSPVRSGRWPKASSIGCFGSG